MKNVSKDAAGFQFPCTYQVKAMGHDDGQFKNTVIELIERHCPKVEPQQVSCRPSKKGKYLAVSVTVQADSHAHLDAIYQTLTGHEKVLMRL